MKKTPWHRARRWDVLILVLATLVWSSPVQAAQADQDDGLVIEHLEYLGYTCDRVEQGIRARHSSKIHLLLSREQNGILLQTGFPGKGGPDDGPGRYVALNAVNARARVARAFWTPDGHLLVSAWMPGGYEKPRFAAFLEAWEEDGQTLRAFAQELKPYLAE